MSILAKKPRRRLRPSAKRSEAGHALFHLMRGVSPVANMVVNLGTLGTLSALKRVSSANERRGSCKCYPIASPDRGISQIG